MSAQILSMQDFSQTEQRISVSFRLLLALYAIIPICFLLQFLDSWFWQGALLAMLPAKPNHLFLFQILFGTPHIIASSILLVSNRDYVQTYQKKLIWMTAAIATVFGIGSLFISYWVFYVLVAAWTVYHVLKQQHGVARAVCRLPNFVFYLLLWLSVIAGLLIYLGIFLKGHFEPQQTFWLKTAIVSLCICLVLGALRYQRYVTTGFGRLFLWSNIFLVLSSFYFYHYEYYLFAILIPRLVHDTTAYIFYVTHDYNKHAAKPQNIIYRVAKHCHLSVFLVLPILSFSVAFILQIYGDAIVNYIMQTLFDVEIKKAITLGLIGYLSLMHYYTEAFTWRQDSPYRRFISFSK